LLFVPPPCTQVSPEIVRELDHGRLRGSAKGAAMAQAQVGKNVAEQLRSLPPVPMIDED
jgi:hypothetical protein